MYIWYYDMSLCDLGWYTRHTHTHTHDVITIQIADFTQLENVHSLKKCIQDISEIHAIALRCPNMPLRHHSISVIK